MHQLLRHHHLETALIREAAAVAELKRILNLRDDIEIRTVENTLVPLKLYDPIPDSTDMIGQVINNRTVINALEFRLEAKRLEAQREKSNLFIPKVGATYSYGAFGGGNDFDGGTGGFRHDVTVAVYWELDSLGFANRSASKRRQSEQRALQARLDQTRTDISIEIQKVLTELGATVRQLEILRNGVLRARNGYELSRERVFENQGLPLEVLGAFESLSEMEMLYAQTVAHYNQLQLFLIKATGRFDILDTTTPSRNETGTAD